MRLGAGAVYAAPEHGQVKRIGLWVRIREGLAVQSDIAVSSPFILPHNKAPDVICFTVLVASLRARDLPWRASIASKQAPESLPSDTAISELQPWPHQVSTLARLGASCQCHFNAGCRA